jgi:hypothetical protein
MVKTDSVQKGKQKDSIRYIAIFISRFSSIFGPYIYLLILPQHTSTFLIQQLENPQILSNMAFRKLFSKGTITSSCRVPSPAATLEHSSSPIKSLPTLKNNAPSKTNLHKEPLTGDSVDKGFFRRFLHRRAVNQLPEFISIPIGEKLREKLKGFNISSDRLHLDGLTPPAQVAGEANTFGISVENAKKVLRVSLMEKLKARLREIPKVSIMYSEFVKVCVDECGNEDQGVEFARMIDQSGNVIVLGNIVYLRPEQVLITFI